MDIFLIANEPIGILAALWLGVLTSISPCPLATNIAAISYIGRRVDRSSHVLYSGLLYTIGRSVAYIVLAMVLVRTALSLAVVSSFLQTYMHQLLGPIMILVGMFLLNLLSFNMSGSGVSEKMQQRVDAMGIWGALFLGLIFALSFCPTSAALYFGALVPLALDADSAVLLPLLYGIGTSLPVVVFAVLLAYFTEHVGKAYHTLAQVEWWARSVTGALFIVIGIYFALKYVFLVL